MDSTPSAADSANPGNSQSIPSSPGDVSQEDRLWAMLSHLLGLLGYGGGVFQYVAPLVVYFVYKDKSKFVAFHALQSLYFQLAVLVAGVICVILGMLTCVGFFLAIPLGVAALIYNIIGAIKAYNGEWFEYWLVGPIARSHVGA